MKKHTLSMRVFSVLLCMAMLCTFAPLTSLAEAPLQVFVGGVAVTAENAADVLGDDTVSYDAATATLTLDGATVTDTFDDAGTAFGIFADGDLTIDVNGINYMNLSSAAGSGAVAGIYAGGDLTVRGEGTLTVVVPNAEGLSCAVFAGGSLDYDITGESDLTVGAAPDSYALAANDTVTFNCATCFYASAQTAVFGQMPTLKNAAALTDAYVYTDPNLPISEKVLTADNAEEVLPTARRVMIESAGAFCFVAGVPVTVENASDVFGDGTVWYDLEKGELVLDNANLTGINFDDDSATDVSVIYGPNSLTIRLIGDNVLDGSGYEPAHGNPTPVYNQGLYISGDATFVGDGNLTAIAGYAVDEGSYGIYCGYLNIFGTGDYEFRGTEVADDGAESYGIYAYNGVTLSGTKYVENESHGVFAIGEDYALHTDYGVNYDSSIYETYYANANDESAMEKADDSTDLSHATRLFWKSTAVAEYDVLVNGVWATGNNRDNVLGDGTVSYNPVDRTLTLSDAKLTVAAAGFGNETDIAALYLGNFDGETVYIYLEGDNVIDLTGFTPNSDVEYLQAIEADCAVDFYGPGSLTIVCDDKITADLYGYYSAGYDVTIENEGGFTIDLPQASEDAAIYGINAGNLYFGPNISIKAKQAENCDEMFMADGVDCFATKTIGGTMEKVVYFDPDYVELQTKLTAYDVWVGDTQVTAQNAADVLGDGTVSYDSYNNALYLNNADVTGGIRCTAANNFAVVLDGDNTVTVSGKDVTAVYAPYLSLVGDGTLSVTVDGTGDVEGIKGEEVHFQNGGNIGVAVAGADYAEGIYAEDVLEFTGSGDVTVSVGRSTSWSCGIYCNMGIRHSGFGNLSVTVDGSDGDACGIFCDGDLESDLFGVISATAGDAQGNSYGAEVWGTLNIEKGAMSSTNYYFKGSTRAIETSNTPNTGDYSLSASDQASGNARLIGPSLEDLDTYKRVWFNPPYKVNSVDDIVVPNDSPVTVDWSFTSAPDYAYVFADADDSSNYNEMIGGGAYTAGSSFTTNTTAFDTSSHKWMVMACYGGDFGELGTTVVLSEPFTVTYYETIMTAWLYVETPQIGFAPSGYFGCSLASYCKEEPQVIWYDLTEDSDGILLKPGEVFKVGHRYGAALQLPLEDCYVVADNALVAARSGTAVDTPWFEDGYTYLGTMFDELVETVSRSEIHYTTYPDEGLTAGDIGFTNWSYLSSGLSANVFSDVTYTWKYNEHTNDFDPATAKTMEDDTPFVGGNYYALEVTLTVKDGFVPDADHFQLYFDYGSYNWNPDRLTYDEATGEIHFLYYYGQMEKRVSSVDILMDEPEVGCKPNDIGYMLKDALMNDDVDDSSITWYKVDGDTYTPIASDTVFEKDATYAAVIWYDLRGFYILSSRLAVTANGNAATEVECYGGDVFSAEIQFGPLTDDVTVVDAIDVTIVPPFIGQTAADAANNASTDCEALAYYTLTWYLRDEMSGIYSPLAPNDVFEEGQIYGAQVDFSLKSGYVGSETPALVDNLTVNGSKPEAEGVEFPAGTFGPEGVGPKSGYICISLEAIPAPEITLTAPATTAFTFGDEALKAVQCGVEYTFEPTFDETVKKVLVNVVDADDVVVYSAASDKADTTVTVDLSDAKVGTYTMTVAAYFFDEKIVSNTVEFAVDAAVIDTIAINDADITPIYGDKAGDHLAYTLPDDCHFTATMNGWWDVLNSCILADDDVFEANGLYAACWNFVADDGYAFADDAVITVNGSADNADTEHAFIDVSGEKPLFILSAKAVFVEAPTEPTETGTEPTATETEPSATGTEPTATETEPTATGTETEPSATVTEPTTTGTEAEDILYGDANGDGNVNMKDVLILRKFLAGIDVSYVEINSDVNGDGNVNMKDVLILRKFLASIITVIDPTA